MRNRSASAVKARKTRTKNLANSVELLIEVAKTSDEVVKAFETIPRSYRCDVFTILDNDAHRTANHALLRRTRNDPEWGPKLFATWSTK